MIDKANFILYGLVLLIALTFMRAPHLLERGIDTSLEFAVNTAAQIIPASVAYAESDRGKPEQLKTIPNCDGETVYIRQGEGVAGVGYSCNDGVFGPALGPRGTPIVDYESIAPLLNRRDAERIATLGDARQLVESAGGTDAAFAALQSGAATIWTPPHCTSIEDYGSVIYDCVDTEIMVQPDMVHFTAIVDGKNGDGLLIMQGVDDDE